VDYSKSSAQPEARPPRRLNWGCGSHVAPGWINSDVKAATGVDLVADVRHGLPLASGSMDYVVSVHALPELSYTEQVPVLGELRRVLRPGGALRLALPDLRKGIDAYLREDLGYFKVDEDAAKTLGGRFIAHMLWYGYSRTLFTADFAGELLERAGFVDVVACEADRTASEFPEIVALDNREDESFFIEARRRPDDSGVAEPPYNPAMPPQGSSVQVLELTHDTPNELVRGHFRVEGSEDGLKVIGWALGYDAAVTQVEVLAGDEVVARAPTVVERPDIAERFPDVGGAETAGFQLTLEPSGDGPSQLILRAALEGGGEAPLGELHVVTSRPTGRRGLFRRRR
jgi:predicted SAM-dependent methyltransferase